MLLLVVLRACLHEAHVVQGRLGLPAQAQLLQQLLPVPMQGQLSLAAGLWEGPLRVGRLLEHHWLSSE